MREEKDSAGDHKKDTNTDNNNNNKTTGHEQESGTGMESVDIVDNGSYD